MGKGKYTADDLVKLCCVVIKLQRPDNILGVNIQEYLEEPTPQGTNAYPRIKTNIKPVPPREQFALGSPIEMMNSITNKSQINHK